MIRRSRLNGTAAIFAGFLAAAAAAPAAAQSELAAIAAKDQMAADDLTAIRSAVQRRADALRTAGNVADKDKQNKARGQARDALLADLDQGGDAFRRAAAQEAAELLGPLVRQNIESAYDACMILARLQQPATAAALVEGLKSRFAAVRYQAAVGLRALQPKLDQADAFRPVLAGLTDAAERETDNTTRAALYAALDFPSGNANFTGRDELLAAVTRILSTRVAGLATGAVDPANDAPIFRMAAGIAPTTSAPPVQLVAALAAYMRAFVHSAIDDPSAASPDAVESCESALFAVLRKHGGTGDGQDKVADLLRASPDPKRLQEALAKLIGRDGQPGVLNQAPWNLPIGLAGPAAESDKAAAGG